MARTIRNVKLDTRSARSRIAERREPYWTVISAGCAIGYRRGAKGGTWIGRLRDDDGRQHYEALGAADDARDADGLTVFNFAQAQERARDFFKTTSRSLAGDAVATDGPFTVEMALDEYFADREHRGSKGLRADRYAASCQDHADARSDRGGQARGRADQNVAPVDRDVAETAAHQQGRGSSRGRDRCRRPRTRCARARPRPTGC